MNMRNMLLAGLLFVAPCFASQNANPAANQPAAGAAAVLPPVAANQPAAGQPTDATSTTPPAPKDAAPADGTKPADAAKATGIGAGIAAFFTAISDKGLAVIDIGATPLTWLLTKTTNLTPQTIEKTGRIVFPIATVAAIYAIYQALEAQNNDNDDEEIFFEDAKYSRR